LVKDSDGDSIVELAIKSNQFDFVNSIVAKYIRKISFDDIFVSLDLNNNTFLDYWFKNVDLNAQDKHGRTFIHFLIEHKKRDEVSQILFKQDSLNLLSYDFELRDNDGNTVLNLACKNSFNSAVYFLCSNRLSDLEAENSIGLTPLHSAILSKESASLNTVKILIKFGANFDKKIAGMSALERAVRENKQHIIDYIRNSKIGSTFESMRPEVEEKDKRSAKYRNLVFEGGSVKGLAYIGAIKAMEENGVFLNDIKRVGGTSAGAIMACLIGVGYTSNEIDELIRNLDFIKLVEIEDFSSLLSAILKRLEENENMNIIEKFISDRSIFNKFLFKSMLPSINMIFDLITKLGYSKGERFLEWIEEKIAIKTGKKHTTFAELKELKKSNPSKNFKDIYMVGTNVSTIKAEYFSCKHTPNMVISDAVRISMSIPLVFMPHRFYEKINGVRVLSESNNSFYVDGGILNNYPIGLFDNSRYLDDFEEEELDLDFEQGFPLNNHETLGFLLIKSYSSIVDSQSSKFSQIFSLLMALYDCLMDKDALSLSEANIDRSIFIDVLNVSTFEFGMNSEKKRNLIHSGSMATHGFFKKQRINLLNNKLIDSRLIKQIIFNSSNTCSIVAPKTVQLRLRSTNPALAQSIYELFAKGNEEELSFFKMLRISVLSLNESNENSLFIAVRENNLNCLKSLVAELSNKPRQWLDSKNSNGQTLINLADQLSRNEIKAYLNQAKMQMNDF
jgi:NTE family protein